MAPSTTTLHLKLVYLRRGGGVRQMEGREEMCHGKWFVRKREGQGLVGVRFHASLADGKREGIRYHYQVSLVMLQIYWALRIRSKHRETRRKQSQENARLLSTCHFLRICTC